MENDRYFKQLLYGELEGRKRRLGGQKLLYYDVVKPHLKAAYIDADG